MTQQAETIVSGGPNVITSTNTNVLTGGPGGVTFAAFTTNTAPVTNGVAGLMYYDTTVGNLMISNATGVYGAVVSTT